MNIKIGRPKKFIYWQMVQDLIQQGYSGPQISEYFEIATATFYRHFIEKYGVRFADYKKKITKNEY